MASLSSPEEVPSAAALTVEERLAQQAKWLVRVSEWGFADPGDLDAALISRSRARQQWCVRDEDFAALEPCREGARGKRYRLADVLRQALRRHGPAGLFEKVQDSREAFKLCPRGCTHEQYREGKLRLHASYWRREYELECARHRDDPDLVERSRDAVRAELRGRLRELERRWKVYEQELADSKHDKNARECVGVQIEIMYEQGTLHRFEKIMRQIRGEEDEEKDEEEEKEEVAPSKNGDGAEDEASGGVASSAAQSKKRRRPTDEENERNGFGSAAKKSKSEG